MHYNNSLKIGSFIFILALFLRNIFGYIYIYSWISIIVLQFISEQLLLNMPIQYGTDKTAMIVFLVLAVIIQIIADWLSFRKRSIWEDNSSIHRVYHHNGEVAEWVNTKASEIKGGNIYKLSPG